MGGACTKTKPGDVSHPVQTKEVRIGQQNQQNKNHGQNEDLISIVSLKSRQSMKKQVNIGYYLVQDVKKLEKDNKKVINQWKKTLSLYEKESQKEIRREKIFTKKTENILFSFKKNKFNEFQSLIESGIPLNLRWNVWKVQLFNKDIYDEQLYERLLQQPIDEHYECAILKDLPRTFPTHPYFQSKEVGGGGFLKLNQLNQGQRQLYNVLKALSIHMPNVGYTQGMNFVVAFLLMMSAGSENESFWIFTLLARDPNFLFMGLFEETLPLMHILICIFERKFKQVLPELYDYFQNILLDSMLWVWKWFITLYLYSFPIEIVAKLWDYIIINGGLSTISLGLALAEYYQKEFLRLDMEDLQTLLREMKETDMLLDKNSKFYLDFTKLQKAAKKYTITSEFASQCISDFVKEKRTDNMYTKFYIMHSQNEKEAINWIHKSVKERVKLNAQETVMHLGSTLRQNEVHQQVNNQNVDESITNLIQMQHKSITIPISNQINSEGFSINNAHQQNENSLNQKLLVIQQEKNIQLNGIGNINQGKKQPSSQVSPLKQSNNQQYKPRSENEFNKDDNNKSRAEHLAKMQQEEDLENSTRQFINHDNQEVQFNNKNHHLNNSHNKESKQPSFTKHINKDIPDQYSQLVSNKENYRASPLKYENEIIKFSSLSEIQDDMPDHLTNVEQEITYHHHPHQKNQIFQNSLQQKLQLKESGIKQNRQNIIQLDQPNEF